ncbi:hypothetical protein [Dyadobacter sp. BHUBP1]|uniref:hypothetical protein n=1 Tax=Dyadobacter sp. BHUBP1 TaxID=3424178 RepID=UPI003D345409
MEHRRDFPPMGRLENARVIEKGEFHYLLVEMAYFPDPQPVNWDLSLQIQQFSDPFQFVEVENISASSIEISFDTINFPSRNQAFTFADEIKRGAPEQIEVTFHGRKSDLPDPEILLRFVEFQALYEISKPLLKKLGEKAADKLVDSAVDSGSKVAKYLLKVLKDAFNQMIPLAKPVCVLFDIPGEPHIELLMKTRDESVLKKAFGKKRLDKVRAKIDELSKVVPIAKIQFVLTTDNKWKFNYLITKKGQTIGTKESFKKRTNVYNSLTNKHSKAANRYLKKANNNEKQNVPIIFGKPLSE